MWCRNDKKTTVVTMKGKGKRRREVENDLAEREK